ncbi:MAG: YraN family protein [Pseudohongiella sp.]|uniref:YraN family protein n=1 Tax=Pseudohongiella sp. TaxID=1979412 RepID=UPI0034A06C44
MNHTDDRKKIHRPVAPDKRRQVGFDHETRAAQFLSQQGLTLIESNFSCRLGEIDLIMQDEETLVFVEVRYRTRADFMDPVTSIDYRKQKKLLRSAATYLKYRGLTDRVPCRIDVLGIRQTGGPGETEFNWIKNAIQATC